MATPRITNEELQQAVNAVEKFGSQIDAARALGLPRETFISRLRTAMNKGIKPTITAESLKSESTLRAKIQQLEAELKHAQNVSAELEVIRGIVGKMSEKVQTLTPPAWVGAARPDASAPGVPTLFLSDLHWGEKVHPTQINGVNQYNVKIAKERLKAATYGAVHLLKIISPKMDYPGIVLPLGGDMISGNIHEELTASNELNSMPSVLDLFSELVGAIEFCADMFGAVFLPCVTGNHGRDTRKIWSKDRHHTSFDWLLYQFLARHFENDKRITFYIPDGPDAYYKIYEHRYMLTHGDQFRGGDGMIGALGPIIRGDHKKRSRAGQLAMNYDTLLLGHWHQYIHLNRLIVNGSLKGYDEYAYDNNFSFEAPQQALWLTHPRYGITYRMPVYVDRKQEIKAASWVSVPKG